MNAGNHPSHKRSWANQKERIQNLPSICLLKIDGKQKTLDTPWKINMEPKVMEVCLWWFYLFNLVIFRFQPFIFRGTNFQKWHPTLTHPEHPTLTQRFFTRLQLLQLFSLHTYLKKWCQNDGNWTRNTVLVGGFTSPPHLKECAKVKLGSSSPRIRGENSKIFELPPPSLISLIDQVLMQMMAKYRK